ncbi:MAG: TPM domain-containing protein [Acidobacteriaceae bacterium]
MVLSAALLGCTLFSAARAEAPDKLPKPTSYVSDFANVIDPASKENIEDLAWQVYSRAHATIEVVTVKSLDGQDIDSFTTALEDNWKVGPKSSDKGIVMVFAIQDHKDRIEVGYGLEGILNDAKVGDIRRSMNPLLEQGQYGPAIQSGVQQIANVIAADANITLTPPQQTPQPVYNYQPVHHRTNWFGIIFFLVFILVMFRGGGGHGWLWFLLGNMMGGGFGGGGGGGGGGFGGGGGGGGGGGDFGGGFGGGSGGGGASGSW